MSGFATHGSISLLYNAGGCGEEVLMAFLNFVSCFESEGEALHPLMEECLISRSQLGSGRYKARY